MGKQEIEVKRENILVIDKDLSWIAVCYDLKLSGYFDWKYCVVDFKESIRRTEE